MSTTDLYRLGNDPECIGEIRNSWRGAMFVWNDIAKRYCRLEGFPLAGPEQMTVWGAWRDRRMSEHERIVLLSTMDNAIVWGKDIPALIAAFRGYSEARGENNSYGEQADLLETIVFKPDDAIAWNQTSVNGDAWCCPWSDEAEDFVWYDPRAGTKHFDVMEEACRDSRQSKPALSDNGVGQADAAQD